MEKTVNRSAETKGTYYYVKLSKGVKKTPELKEKIDRFVNEHGKTLHSTAGKALDLSAMFSD